ncbi:metalloregulator ArsR/SmtB family transcription factor [Nitratireductor sp. XY-223]|uniref:ArsR/SmtB family transcription factor n=1 Tax=Nitratireductor sp. XY-223 TaxID=2561926 RepID=UPI0010AACB6D|nr:metalloregulator ArsR/SmtB family transcription factor [Nitratireductor sp. XY-223]
MNVQHIFSALSDPTRFAIVEQLLEKGDQTAGSLAEPFNISKPAISRHLKVLEEAGVIERKIDRQFRSFSVRPQSLRSLDDWIGRYRRFWQTSFDRLEKVLQDNKEKENKDDDRD